MRSIMYSVGKPHNYLNGSLADVCGLVSVTVIVAIDRCTYYIIPSNQFKFSPTSAEISHS